MQKLVRFIVRKSIKRWGEIHKQEVRSRYGLLEGWVSIGVNLFLAAVKGIIGTLAGSVALIADAFHTLSDVLTSAVVIGAFRIARKPSDVEHPFGHGRMEAIGTVIVAVLLLVVGIEIFRGAVGRVLHPKNFDASWIIIAVITFTIVIKEVLAQFSRELGDMIGSMTLEADFWHHRTDALSSVLVIIAFISQRFGISYLDGAAGIVVAGMIMYTGWKIARKGIDDLLGTQPSDKFVQDVKGTVREFPEVLDVHDLIIHQYGQKTVLSFHIEISDELSLKHAHTVAERIEKEINRKFNTFATVHFDPVSTRDPEIKKLRAFIQRVLEGRDEIISIHDLRSVGDEGAKNILFDLVVDPGVGDRAIKELKGELQEAILKAFPSVMEVVVEVEPKYVL